MDITEYAMMKKVFKKLSPDSDPVLQEKTITENGEYTPDDGYDGLSKVIVNVAGGGGQNDTILLEEQELSFILRPDYGVYSALAPMSTNALVIGETYRVKWGEDEFTCVAMDGSSVMSGAVFIGNGSGWGLSGNNEPFLIVGVPSAQYADVISLTDAEPTTRIVKVWQEHTSADLVYVTFWSHDGAEKLHTRAVVKGNTCMCPVTGAIKEIDTPTRESTELYRYIFGGWSTTANGALNESALEAIIADKTVYAYFTAVTRFYTVNFYDGNTLLSTQQVAYGMSATPPNAEKEGYRLDGWSPAYTNITGDTDCYAVWTEKLTFANATWAEIAEISEAGEAASYFKVGDTKAVACGDETIVVTVAGFNHDTLTDGGGKAGMSIVCTKVPTRTALWGGSKFYNNCGLQSAKNGILTDLPTELQAVIKSVDKTYDTTNATGTSPTTATISEKLWILSAAELGCNFTYTNSSFSLDYTTNTLTRLGSRYELFPSKVVFADGGYDAPAIYDCNGNGVSYYTRNIYRKGDTAPTIISFNKVQKLWNGGFAWSWQDGTPYPICFGFCI